MSILSRLFFGKMTLATAPARHGAVLLALSASLLFGTACQPQTGTSSASGTAAATGEKTTVSLAFFPNLTHAAALVGTGNGAFQKALGPNVTLKETVFTAGPAEIEALFAGEVDLGYIGPGPALNGYLKSNGAALKIIAGASSGGAALVARSDVPIRSVADLAGKRVAVPQTGGTQDISLRHALQVANLTPKDKGGSGAQAVDVVQYAPADTLTQFQQKTIDAAWVPEPWVSRLVADAGAKIVQDERDLWPNRKFATTVVVVRTDFLNQHPDLVQKFLAAHSAVVRDINKNPDVVRPVLGERLKTLNKGKGLPDAIIKTALTRLEVTDDPLQESVLTFADWSKALGYQRQDRSALAGLFDTKSLEAARQTVAAPASSASPAPAR